MFTGIVEELGSVRRVLPGSRAGKIVIAAHKVLEGTRTGVCVADFVKAKNIFNKWGMPKDDRYAILLRSGMTSSPPT